MKYRSLCLVLVALAVNGALGVRSVFGSFFSNDEDQELPVENSVDGGPLAHPQVAGFSVTENEFTKIRIEYIKNQILKKLRLKEKPTVAVGNLPKPVKEYENLLPDQDMSLQSSYSDDFYGKTTQAIIFPYEGKFTNTY